VRGRAPRGRLDLEAFVRIPTGAWPSAAPCAQPPQESIVIPLILDFLGPARTGIWRTIRVFWSTRVVL
jgi:hypothetical protein